MKYQSYNSELRTAVAQVLDVFNDIKIERLDADGQTQKTISVPSVYGSRSRILKSLENKEKVFTLPLISISRQSIQRDSTRCFSTKADILSQIGNSPNHETKTPIPINITFSMSILCRYMSDLDQIVSNFVPFMNPEIYVAWKHPKTPSTTLTSQILWDGSIDETGADEITEDEPMRVEATTTFTYKTWVFTGRGEYKPDPDASGIIKRINFNPNLAPVCPVGGNPDEYAYGLSDWYSVPVGEDFGEFTDKIVRGYIKDFDKLQISGGVNGYWQDISGNVKDTVNLLNAEDNTYLVDEAGNLLVMADAPLNAGMEEVDFINIYNESLSGDLQTY